MSRAYYNEFDPKAAATLRELINVGAIAPGDVDERSIEDVLPSELAGYSQCHFFAGFGIWSYALRLAGWPDDRKVWTGSCPCQPFSAAGKGAGFADERHLWPAFFHLIQHGKRFDVPLYGEQVASPDALAWLDVVCADLEAENHAVRTFDLCAAGFGAPIIRQRLFWLACSPGQRRFGRRPGSAGNERDAAREQLERLRDADGLACSPGQRSLSGACAGIHCSEESSGSRDAESQRLSTTSRLDGAIQPGLEGLAGNGDGASGRTEPLGSATETSPACRPGPTNGFWGVADWLHCRDDKWRPVESGTFPLAYGYPERMGILRGAGNAINAEVAKAFIEVSQGWLQ